MSKPQYIRKDAVILSVVSPKEDTHVKIVHPKDFAKMEADKNQVHYCSIVDNRLYLSSKAPYKYVVVNYAP